MTTNVDIRINVLNGYSAACDITGKKIRTLNTEVLHLSRNLSHFPLQVDVVSLKSLVEKLKYLRSIFENDGRQNKELDV